MRAAAHIVVLFNVSSDKHTFRLVIDPRRTLSSGDISKSEIDDLGVPTWQKVGECKGLPSKDRLLALALAKVFADLPPHDDHRLYPEHVSCQADPSGGSLIEIYLGVVTP